MLVLKAARFMTSIICCFHTSNSPKSTKNKYPEVDWKWLDHIGSFCTQALKLRSTSCWLHLALAPVGEVGLSFSPLPPSWYASRHTGHVPHWSLSKQKMKTSNNQQIKLGSVEQTSCVKIGMVLTWRSTRGSKEVPWSSVQLCSKQSIRWKRWLAAPSLAAFCCRIGSHIWLLSSFIDGLLSATSLHSRIQCKDTSGCSWISFVNQTLVDIRYAQSQTSLKWFLFCAWDETGRLFNPRHTSWHWLGLRGKGTTWRPNVESCIVLLHTAAMLLTWDMHHVIQYTYSIMHGTNAPEGWTSETGPLIHKIQHKMLFKVWVLAHTPPLVRP